MRAMVLVFKPRLTTVAFLLLFFLFPTALAEPYVEITRDGGIFTVITSIEIERSVEKVWPFMWEFRHIKGYADNVERIDSLGGGEDWYDVRYVGDFPLLHAEITNRKWIIDEGKSVGTKLVNFVVKSPLPFAFICAEGFWRLDSLGPNRSRVYFKNVLEVQAAGMEWLYTPIAKRDGRRIMKNFKRYVESR